MAKWADFETHPVGTTDRIKELEAKLDQAIWETIYWEEHLKRICNLFEKAETGRQVLLGRVEDLEAEIEQWKFDSAAGWDKCEEYRLKLVELEAENKFLNQQMDSIEEMGTDDLNALPDCLMRLAPALGENKELKAKLFKTEGLLAKAIDALEKVQAFVKDLEPYADQGHTLVPALREACEVLVVLKGEK